MNFSELLKKDFILLDGAMGTMLQDSGLEIGEIPELLSLSAPEKIIEIHKKYIENGAMVVYTNTFGANRYKLEDSGFSPTTVIRKSIDNAKIAALGTSTLIALDIGPIGQLLEPTGTLTFEDAYEIFKEQIIAGEDADIIVFETMTDLYEAKAAILAAKENSKLPIFCTMTFEENLRTFTGCSVSSMAITLEGLGVDAIGINCSLGPSQLYPIVEELSHWTNLPIIVKPNAGLPDPNSNKYDVSPEEFASQIAELIPLGIKIIGGCCGTTPEYTEKIQSILESCSYKKLKKIIPTAVCTPSKTVVVDIPRVIGERINPTGKKLFKEALLHNDIDYILNQAIEQIHAGADILDVNVGLPNIDEKVMMVTSVKALQGIVDTPLQIDSTIPEVLEAALRIYNGKPIVNSVNGEDDTMSNIFPLVKKYGAAVIGLTLDKDGIPSTAEGRFKIAEKIVIRALKCGIPKENIIIDCLTLTASAEQAGVLETIKAVNMVKNRLNVKTVLGVSNISFGLPNRELINHNFLTMCLSNGLDLAIINPNIPSMMGAIRAFKLLSNIDKNANEYIIEYGTEKAPVIVEKNDIDIFYAVENGLKKDGGRITSKLLETTDAMEIINNMLIPALDKVGVMFEQGKFFLPQLILSAGVAEECFKKIKAYLLENNIAPVNRGKIILATVKGDIHDIGKNIVKVLLENYGYTVIDLGRDVPYETVLEAAIKYEVGLVGLSALMTTTLKSMENTIKLLHDSNVPCKIMVGGAVLTPEYAIKIGADFYAKDAKESVDIAKIVLNEV